MDSGQNCNSPPLSSTTSSAGCGCPSDITVNITPTTGGSWFIRVDPQTSIENFKKIVSKKLKVHKERICLLYRDKQLREGNLMENGLVDGARLTLLPSVETGLLTQRPELSVMQALESLNDNQVNDFLSGKAPLNLTMRLGDHMMLIQLQLSTVTAGGGGGGSASSVATPLSPIPTSTATDNSFPATSSVVSNSSHSVSPANSNNTLQTTNATQSRTSSRISTTRPLLLSSLASALAVAKEETIQKTKVMSTQTGVDGGEPMEVTASSPIQSLSDLASRPTVPVPTAARIPQSHSPPQSHSSATDPIAAGLTSCLCRSLSPPCSCVPSNNSIDQQSSSSFSSPTSSTSSTSRQYSSTESSPNSHPNTTLPTRLDTRALAQASRNLTQTLRQLSTEVLSSREIEQRAQGAIIESMQHHGRGVYSGTFSGTLNPALQDSRGRPRRDISTIVHILNDLLCAAPPVRRSDAASSISNSDSNASSIPSSSHISIGSNNFMSPASPKSPCDCPKCSDSYCTTSASTGGGGVSIKKTGNNSSNSQIESQLNSKASTSTKLPLSIVRNSRDNSDTNAEQNLRTRDKIEQLRLVMGERRERRRLRKQKIQPYTIPSDTTTSTDPVSA